MQRVLTAELDLDLGSSVDLIFQISAAQGVPLSSEELTFSQGDRVYTPTEIVDQSGSRLHRLSGEQGPLSVRYEAVVAGASPTLHTSDLETITYLRPSRYCQSDEVFHSADGFEAPYFIGMIETEQGPCTFAPIAAQPGAKLHLGMPLRFRLLERPDGRVGFAYAPAEAA